MTTPTQATDDRSPGKPSPAINGLLKVSSVFMFAAAVNFWLAVFAGLVALCQMGSSDGTWDLISRYLFHVWLWSMSALLLWGLSWFFQLQADASMSRR